MIAVVIAAVKNEADLIEPFVRHNLALADRMLLVDNGSSDRTLEILRQLQAEGLPVEVDQDPSLGQYQRERVTRLMQRALAYSPDWILPLDADELLLSPLKGGCFVDGNPAFLDLTRPLHLSWRSYVPDPADDPAELNPFVRLRQRLTAGSGPWVKAAIPGALAARPSASVSQGNHALLMDGTPVPGPTLEHAFAHFPIRSPGQLAVKVAQHWLQLLAMSRRAPTWSFQYVEPFKLMAADPRAFLDAFYESHRWFAECGGPGDERELAPFPYLGGPLRYTRADAGGLASAASQILRHAKALAEGYAASQTEAESLARAFEQQGLEAAARGGQLEARARAAEARAAAAEAGAASAEARGAAAEARTAAAEASASEATALAGAAQERAQVEAARAQQAAARAGEADLRAQQSAVGAAEAQGREAAAARSAEAALQGAAEAKSRAVLAESRAIQAEVRALQAEVRAAKTESARAAAVAAIESLASTSPVRFSRLLLREAPTAHRLLQRSARLLLRALDLARSSGG